MVTLGAGQTCARFSGQARQLLCRHYAPLQPCSATSKPAAVAGLARADGLSPDTGSGCGRARLVLGGDGDGGVRGQAVLVAALLRAQLHHQALQVLEQLALKAQAVLGAVVQALRAPGRPSAAARAARVCRAQPLAEG